MKEKMGTDFCQAEHFGYLEMGHVKISMGAMYGGEDGHRFLPGRAFWVPRDGPCKDFHGCHGWR